MEKSYSNVYRVTTIKIGRSDADRRVGGGGGGGGGVGPRGRSARRASGPPGARRARAARRRRDRDASSLVAGGRARLKYSFFADLNTRSDRAEKNNTQS